MKTGQYDEVGTDREKFKQIIIEMKKFGLHSALSRRVNQEYMVPRKRVHDPYVKKRGLYPSVGLPYYYDGVEVIAVYGVNIIQASKNGENILFDENIRGFRQRVMHRHTIPRKGRFYYSEREWTHDSSPEGLYTNIIFPEWLVGKKVMIIAAETSE